MPSVTCEIRSKLAPEKWIQVEIGVEEGSEKKYWRLTRKSSVAFLNFSATSGKWSMAVYMGPVDTDDGLALWLENPDPDPFGGFTLLRTGPDFYRLMCGRWIDGVGTREKHSDVKSRMDFLCV